MINKKRKKLIFLIIGILICIIVLLISIVILSSKNDSAVIDLSKKEESIEKYLNGKIIPQGISTFIREYKGDVSRDEFYECLYSVSSFLPDLTSSLKETTDYGVYYDENSENIKKLIGIENKDEFIELANYLVENDISEDEFEFCLYEKGSIFNTDEYGTFKMKFNYKNFGDIEFTLRISNYHSNTDISILKVMPPAEEFENF